jgi:hypothetical protein
MSLGCALVLMCDCRHGQEWFPTNPLFTPQSFSADTYPVTKTVVEIAARSRNIIVRACPGPTIPSVHRSLLLWHCLRSTTIINLHSSLLSSFHASPQISTICRHVVHSNQRLLLTPPFQPSGVSTLKLHSPLYGNLPEWKICCHLSP